MQKKELTRGEKMERNNLIAIIVIVALVAVVGGYAVMNSVNHPTYGEGTYIVGEDISPGTYNRTDTAYVLNGHFISAGDIMVIDNSPNAKVVVEKGEITKINDSTEYASSSTYFEGTVT